MVVNGEQIITELPDGISYGMSTFANGNAIIILSVFIAIYVTADYAHGTMKNVISKGFSKVQVYFSKVISMVVASFIIILSTVVVAVVSASIVSGSFGEFSAENIAIIFKNMGIELLLNTALASVYVMIGMVIKNLGGTIAVNIFGVSMFGPLLFQLAEFAVHGKIKFTEFSLLNNMSF
jgi:ABC-2 type transport system permease protein